MYYILVAKVAISSYRKIRKREMFVPGTTARSFYKGGFSNPMTKREALLILNLRENATPE